jgi:hypothetical protein
MSSMHNYSRPAHNGSRYYFTISLYSCWYYRELNLPYLA